jgi:hypothetical protein
MSAILEEIARQRNREVAERARKSTYLPRKPHGRHAFAHHLRTLANRLDG